MSSVALSYEMPFVDRVTMLAKFAHWLARLCDPPNRAVLEAPIINGAITWDYAEHGPLPWMQFFYDWRFADLTGDGSMDFILTCGAFRQIAYRQDGAVLWRYEQPPANCMDIRMDSNFPIADIDGDGVPEIVCARKVDGALRLCVVDARTGEVKKSIPFPERDTMPEKVAGGHFRCSITVINASGRSVPSDILIGWDYRSVTLLDSDLNLLWKRKLGNRPDRRHRTLGHSPHAADIDADGRDEVLASSCLLDDDGRLLWVAPDLPALVEDGHADSVRIVRLTDGGRPNMVMSTGAYCFSAEGELLWGRDDLKHGQAQRVGRIRADLPGRQMIVYEGASRVDPNSPDRIVALDSAGNLLWHYEVVQPDMQEGGFGFWLGDWDGDGLDEVFVNDPDKVLVLNGHGKLIDEIPGHLIYVFDLIGDARAEAVVLTGIEPGMRMQIVTNDRPNPNPETNGEIARRRTNEAMYNCTRY